MKKIFLAIIITVFYSCGKEKIPVTFLEKYNNTVWEIESSNVQIDFYKISNDLSYPLDMVYSLSYEECYRDGHLLLGPDNIEIVKNLEDTLVFNVTQFNNGTLIDLTKTTIRIDGESLIWEVQAFYQGVMKFENVSIFQKTNLDFNNIDYCN